MRKVIRVPGRVNLIGDHTDYTGGWVMPMAIDRWTMFEIETGGGRISLRSEQMEGFVGLALAEVAEGWRCPTSVPDWGRYVAAAMIETGPSEGFVGEIRSTIPVGAGLSSSAALAVGLVMAMLPSERFPDQLNPLEIAQIAQRVEHRATGVPTGIMDQLCIAGARAGHATLIDCARGAITHVPFESTEALQVQVLFVAHRTLEGSAYSDRVRECAEAESMIGPLVSARLSDLEEIESEVLRKRVRHVITENARVHAFAQAVASEHLHLAGEIMSESHRSLAEDYEVSTAEMDQVVASISALPRVWGARMAGGGFGGCVVAITEQGVEIPGAWTVAPVGSAEILS
jgi:galactokinase